VRRRHYRAERASVADRTSRLSEAVHDGSSLASVALLDVFDDGDHPLNATDYFRQALFDNVGSDRRTSKAQPSAADGGGEQRGFVVSVRHGTYPKTVGRAAVTTA
jgi:hypothetical protein